MASVFWAYSCMGRGGRLLLRIILVLFFIRVVDVRWIFDKIRGEVELGGS